ncbi:MAG: hypothetical protein V4642_12405 [Bacteroidota bacterium]
MAQPYLYDRTLLTTAVLAKFKAQHPTVNFIHTPDGNSVLFSFENSGAPDRERFLLDLHFFLHNPHLPLENICSRLDNYYPKNASQEELLYYAQRLVELDDDSIGAGLYIVGEAGIGKSHIAIGISKEFMRHGLEPNFVIAEQYRFNQKLELGSGQVWVIDDMNSGYHISSRLFKEVVINAFDRGGRVFVTSNKDYDELMKEAFVGDSTANRIRYGDRTKGMFKILHVTGDSFRQANAWYK